MKNNLVTYPFPRTFNLVQQINVITIKKRLSYKPHKFDVPHRTDFHMIYLFTGGVGSHMVDFRQFDVQPGHILFISKGQVHTFDPSEPYDALVLVFTESFLCRSKKDKDYLQNSPLFDHVQQPYFEAKENYKEMYALLIKIYKELKSPPDKFQGELLHHMLYQILLLSERQLQQQIKLPKPEAGQARLISRFKKLVEQYYKSHRQVQFYAKQLAVSQRTLQLATAQALGKTPKEWIAERLLLEIKRILAYDTLSVKEIAAATGYSEVTNLVKFFKRKTGITPEAFRNTF
ncbi:hypothetical protein BAY13_17355 [Elizabethkingia bruuniana]|uniref:AraC family transcriptional regulator n=1 Tax=Elizabethkingia bruuniana TaxID=1756149 RepID=UPI00099AED68|nr:helix-turn-helix domain-containing protein [Elizabethkingia bruuniana]OPC66498.1 hypothetical protein BAY13_17355 [Elizabethkingia bruuniana]